MVSEAPAAGEANTGTAWSFRSPSNLSAAIYGSVLAASIAVGASGQQGGALAAVLIVTGFVFWVAHVYAQVAASVHGWNAGVVRRGLLHEWPLMATSIPPAIAVIVAKLLPGDAPADGAWVACLVAIAEQQFFGAVALREADLTRTQRVRRALLNLSIGVVIILLKVVLPAH
jgi:hypothetical protein